MIEAYFDGRTALITGASQYDTGQRIRLNGLPSPEELGEADEFLSGDLVAVQAHFSYRGDAQAQVRLAQWDDENYCWVALIPDEYLTRSEEVNVHVVVSHGADSTGSRNKTRYEGVFTPTSRPAPNNVVSDDQLERWEDLKLEVDLAIVNAQNAQTQASTKSELAKQAAEVAAEAAEVAKQAASAANSAAAKLNAVDARWAGMSVVATTLPQGQPAAVHLEGQTLTLGIPRGETGPQGDPGQAGPTDIGLSFNDGVLTITRK